MGATTQAINSGDSWITLGNRRGVFATVTMSSSYATGGDTVTAAAFGLVSINDIDLLSQPAGYVLEFDKTNLKMKAYRTGTLTPAGTVAAPTFTGTASGASLIDTAAGIDIKGSAAANVGIAGGALQTNGSLIANLEAANNTTNFTIALHPDWPRNIGIAFKNTNAGASTGNAVGCVITGTFRGAAQTETISFSAAELTSTAQNEVATKYGAKPFDTVTSITNPVAQPAGWQHAAGPGSKVGLPVDLLTPAEADVLKAVVTAANYSVTGKVDTTNMTIDIGVTADGADFYFEYKHATAALTPAGTNSAPSFTGTATTASALAEVGATTNLSTVIARVFVMGW